MKRLLTLIGISAGVVFAVPAYAEPGIDEPVNHSTDGDFLENLKRVGIGFSDPAQAISAGEAVCAHVHNGMSGLHLIKHLQENNPALTENGAAQFATISAKAFCPKQLDEAEEPGQKNLNKGPATKSGG